MALLGGMWGMAIKRDRPLAQQLFKTITNRYVASYYNRLGTNPKGFDQHMLTRFFSSHLFKNSTTHDSFRCKILNGQPWPTQRAHLVNCFVGCANVIFLYVFVFFFLNIQEFNGTMKLRKFT